MGNSGLLFCLRKYFSSYLRVVWAGTVVTWNTKSSQNEKWDGSHLEMTILPDLTGLKHVNHSNAKLPLRRAEKLYCGIYCSLAWGNMLPKIEREYKIRNSRVNKPQKKIQQISIFKVINWPSRSEIEEKWASQKGDGETSFELPENKMEKVLNCFLNLWNLD